MLIVSEKCAGRKESCIAEEPDLRIPRLPLTFLPNAGSSLTANHQFAGLSHNLHGAPSPRGVLFIELGTTGEEGRSS